MNNLLKKLTPPEPLGQCDSNFIGMFQTVRFIQMMSLTFGLFTQVSGSGPLGPLVYCASYVELSQRDDPIKMHKIFSGNRDTRIILCSATRAV